MERFSQGPIAEFSRIIRNALAFFVRWRHRALHAATMMGSSTCARTAEGVALPLALPSGASRAATACMHAAADHSVPGHPLARQDSVSRGRPAPITTTVPAPSTAHTEVARCCWPARNRHETAAHGETAATVRMGRAEGVRGIAVRGVGRGAARRGPAARDLPRRRKRRLTPHASRASAPSHYQIWLCKRRQGRCSLQAH
jgi:hypothetical protein